MDPSDDYYQDILDGLSDEEYLLTSSDDDGDGEQGQRQNKKKRNQHSRDIILIDKLRNHLTEEEFKILRNDCNDLDEDSNQLFELEMANEARNHINGVHINKSNLSLFDQKKQQQQIGSDEKRKENSIDNSTEKKTKELEKEELEKQNDELFYDPDEDDSNQQWMNSRKIQPYSPTPAITTKQPENYDEKQRKLQASVRLKKPRSDATLNCPCCLTLLCLDCQRHEIYKTQYRAMFVLNCRVDFQKKLIHQTKKKEWRKKFRQHPSNKRPANTNKPNELPEQEKEDQQQQQQTTDLYYPVHCCVCNTQVAVYDLDEVYHFFSVIASH